MKRISDKLEAADHRITKRTDGFGGSVWLVPASRKFNFFLFFASFWLLVTGVLSGSFLFAFLGGQEIEGNLPEWVLIPFFGVFWAVGLGVLYFGLKEAFEKLEISVSGNEFLLRREMFGRVREKRCTIDEIERISQKVFYQKNDRPVYGIEVKGPSRIKFGSNLEEGEKAWLVDELKNEVANVMGTEVSSGEEFGGVKEYFSIVIPSSAKGLFSGGIIIGLVAIVFLAVGIFVMDGGLADGALESFENGEIGGFLGQFHTSHFRVLWLCLSFFLFGLALFLLSRFQRQIGQERRLEGNEVEVSIRIYRRGLVLKDLSFPRALVTGIRATDSGTMNGSPMKRVDLIVTEKTEKIASWMEEDHADALVDEVRAALGI